MISCNDVSLFFGGEPILKNLSWQILENGRIGLVGPNGAGKSTLLRIIAGHLEPDEGTVAINSDWTVGYLPQEIEVKASHRSVREVALEAFAEVHRVEKEIEKITTRMEKATNVESPEYQKMLQRLGNLQQELVTHEAHRIDSKTEAVLAGLGFSAEEMDRPLRNFSGGWRMRVALAKLLLKNHEVLLLDEPTNHLDIESIDWFETYLQNYPGTVVVVSHDRYFLDRMVSSVAELTRGRISEYDGNYSYYLTEREHRREQQQAAYDNQQRKIKEIEAFINKFRYNASKAAQVQSRVKQLEKMDRIPPPVPEEQQVRFRFPEPPRSGKIVLELSTFSKTYDTPEGGTETVFDQASPLHIDRGDKIALIGANGTGKSTLARILLDNEPFEGNRTKGHNVSITYFAQHQAEALTPSHTVLEEAQAADPATDRSQIRSLLGAFLFNGDDVFKPVRVLSGGEKSRLALARTLLNPANLLILDEPTNHLDMASREVLIEALQQFAGTFLVISHDRHFLDKVANRVWHIQHDGNILTYPGSYSDYRWSQEHGTMQNKVATATEETTPDEETNTSTSSDRDSGPKSKEQKRQEAKARNRRYRQQNENGQRDWSQANRYQLQQEIDEVEEKIFAAEEQQELLEEKLANPALYNEDEDAADTVQMYNTVKATLKELYEHWETLATYMEEKEN